VLEMDAQRNRDAQTAVEGRLDALSVEYNDLKARFEASGEEQKKIPELTKQLKLAQDAFEALKKQAGDKLSQAAEHFKSAQESSEEKQSKLIDLRQESLQNRQSAEKAEQQTQELQLQLQRSNQELEATTAALTRATAAIG